MVAARDIDQGELIFSEEALVKGPNHTITTPHCLECLKVGIAIVVNMGMGEVCTIRQSFPLTTNLIL